MPGPGVWLAAIALFPVACGDDQPAPRDAGAAPVVPFQSALIGDPAAPIPPFQLVLDSPGAEPRRQLRYRVTSGSRERTRMMSENTMEILVAGRRVNKVTSPSTEVAFELSVEAAAGRYLCTASVVEASSIDWERIAPGRGSELRQALEQLRGHEIRFEVDDRGIPLSRSIELPDSIESNRAAALPVLKSIDAAIVPFPAEPVGVGATWTVVSAERARSTLAGLLKQKYTLVARRGDRVELTMTLELPQDPAPLELGDSELAVYTSGAATGTIRIAVDLRRILPVLDGKLETVVEGRSFVVSEELLFRAQGTTRQRMQAR